jgi:hypothetical protein
VAKDFAGGDDEFTEFSAAEVARGVLLDEAITQSRWNLFMPFRKYRMTPDSCSHGSPSTNFLCTASKRSASIRNAREFNPVRFRAFLCRLNAWLLQSSGRAAARGSDSTQLIYLPFPNRLRVGSCERCRKTTAGFRSSDRPVPANTAILPPGIHNAASSTSPDTRARPHHLAAAPRML